MARSRRPQGRARGRFRRRKADWVYRPDIYINETQSVLGGWAGTTENDNSIGSGAGAAEAFILLDSSNVLRQYSLYDQVQSSTVQGGLLPTAARPEYKRLPVVKCVEGWIGMRVSSWTLGSRVGAVFRLGWFEQDMDTGLLSLDIDWGIMDVSQTEAQRGPAISANDSTKFMKQWFVFRQATGDNPPLMNLPIFWKGSRRAPSENHCLAMYIEGFDPGSYAAFFVRRMVRTLVA